MKQTIGKLVVEAVLIVFSVLLAFWIDDRRQAADDATLRKVLLGRIHDDIWFDSLRYSEYLDGRERVKTSLYALIEYVNAGGVEADSLTGLLLKVEWFRRYQSNNSTYSSIINSGQMKLFERDTLFFYIVQYYNENANIISFTDAYMKGSTESLSPYLNVHFDRRLFVDRSLKSRIDLHRFTSKEFSNILYSLADKLVSDAPMRQHLKYQTTLLGYIRKSM